MELDDDDWGLSAEDFDFLERDAQQRIAQQQLLHQQQQQQQQSSLSSSSSCFLNQNRQNFRDSNKPIFDSSSYAVDSLLPEHNTQPSLVAPMAKSDESSKGLQKLFVKFILHASGNVAAKFPYDPVLVAAVRKVPKATWNSKERLWIFPVDSLSSAEKVFNEISGYNIEVDSLDPLVQRAITAASAVQDLRESRKWVNSKVVEGLTGYKLVLNTFCFLAYCLWNSFPPQEWYDRIPDFIESELLPFQREGVRFALRHGGRILLADEMGLGKTLQAIAITACIRDSWPVLILTPSSLRLHWASMIQQWLHISSSDILVVLSQWSGSNRSGFTVVSSNTKGTICLDGLFNIISYDIVPKLQNVLMESDFKVVIADESHFLKNAQAKRTTASLPIIKKAQYVILLSGTPALSRPIELFKQLEALYPTVYKNVHEYGKRYCRGGIFGVYQGASNHEELHILMKATIMIRRLKKDVLSELPCKRRQQVFLELADKDMKQINALFRELEMIKGKIKACTSKEELESLKFCEKNLINKIYTDSAEAKIPAVLDYLGTVIEAGCKFLIFAHHQPMIDAIHEFLLRKKVGCIRIDGSTPPASRHTLVTDFQEKDAVKAAVLSIKAGGVGLTLTAASTVIFAELSWTPGDLIQAEDRAHRIGQVSSVNVHYLLANDTVDDIIWDVVQSKLENLGQVLDGHENALEVSASQQRSSPAKQKTLHSFIKHCSNVDNLEHKPKLKFPRH